MPSPASRFRFPPCSRVALAFVAWRPRAQADRPGDRCVSDQHGRLRHRAAHRSRAAHRLRTSCVTCRRASTANTLIHRVVPNFVIQGGGHDAATLNAETDPRAASSTSPATACRTSAARWDWRAATAPHSGNAEFYVNLVDNPDLDPVPTRWGYAVFGRVVQGMDVIDQIGETPTGAVGPFKSDAPLKPVIIERSTIIGADRGGPGGPAPVTPGPAAEASSRRSSAAACGPVLRQLFVSDVHLDASRARATRSSCNSSRRPPRARRRSTSSATCSRPGWATMSRSRTRRASARGCRR